MGVTRIARVTLPRFEVQYSDVAAALKDAHGLEDARILVLDHEVPGDLGSEVVIDFDVVDSPMAVTLLFRIVTRREGKTVLEWWPRRTTDPDLLSLLIVSLAAQLVEVEPGVEPPAIPIGELRKILDRCRQALSHNPFVALNVHWSDTSEEVIKASDLVRDQMAGYRALPGLSPDVATLMSRASEEVLKAFLRLSTLEGRRNARARFVAADQIRKARDLAVARVEVMRLRGNFSDLAKAEAELEELRAPMLR